MSHLRQSLRSAPAGLAFLLALAHCSGTGGSGGSGGSSGGNSHVNVGFPCVPQNESDPNFSGFRVTEESIETNAPACGGDVCLVNHFQGRVSCPLGQSANTAPTPGHCQAAGLPVGANLEQGIPKSCCLPGTNTPVEAPACGQCAPQSHRNADSAVYCSCRCGPADGATADPADTFCGCPAGFVCSEIRKDLGIGDTHLAGKYCIKEGSAYTGNSGSCGQVSGNDDITMCAGVPAGGP